MFCTFCPAQWSIQLNFSSSSSILFALAKISNRRIQFFHLPLLLASSVSKSNCRIVGSIRAGIICARSGNKHSLVSDEIRTQFSFQHFSTKKTANTYRSPFDINANYSDEINLISERLWKEELTSNRFGCSTNHRFFLFTCLNLFPFFSDFNAN